MRLLVRAQDLTWFSFALAEDKNLVHHPVRFQGPPEVFFHALVALMRKWGINFADLTSLAVVSGPGSYTALRGSLTVVNMIAWANTLPVGTLKARPQEADTVVFQKLARQRVLLGRAVTPDYGAPPKITKPKK